MTIEYNNKRFLALPVPDEANYVEVVEGVVISEQPQESDNNRTVTYGRDLNSSDLLLLGVNKPLKKIMAYEYGIGEEFSWEYPAVFSSTSRKVIIDDGGGRYFVKEKPKYCCNPYSLSLAAQFQRFLSEKTDFVPKIIPVKSGDPYLKIGETSFFTTEFKQGRIFNASLRDIENAGSALGTIHILSQEFSFPDPRHIHASEDSLEFVELADKLKGAEKDGWRQETIKSLRNIVGKYKRQLDGNTKTYMVNHGDYAPFNLVYDENGRVVAVNDFDNVNFRPRTRDIAGALLSFGDGLSYAGATSTLRKPIAITLNLGKARAFMKGYLANSAPLSPQEKSDLVGEMCVRWVKIMALGIVRGDFNYKDVLNSLGFVDYLENNISTLI